MKPVALSIVELRYQLVRQSSYGKFKIMHTNLLEAFKNALKAHLGLVMSSKHCQAVIKEK